ncbi:hypothetical protein MJO29_001725 [Puccinia striiformis f. sp. tritici]|uniref:hypothetical protein n=1 Tax=Puccinia striiformis f. sp. tritici TaxID=168172 RepID=UPI0020088444|nr:hypothetical protein Pst134EA_003073 [Puccinia striiformis f. sp. tritici]KAH9472461.1 hypothetical protein Pst134EA_003073 [Puccinia striiformis f. sp. tritici]KAI7965977.1 hypothetical protein MJO29_001725 [Puccinia striiformis f. sp. tritici]KAI9620418.1 hypothetical protein H4Q26_013630 [Puccinia striiformis f. sp. tritici PST-130]
MLSTMIFLASSFAAFLPSCVSGQAQNNSMICYASRPAKTIDFRHCQGALNKINFDQNNRLDSVSDRVLVWHKTCVINVHKNVTFTPSRAHIEGTVREIFHNCNSTGGYRTESHMSTRVYQSSPKNVYPQNQPICHKRKCTFEPNDCLLAFNQIPVDHSGNFKPNFENDVIHVKRGNCTVSVKTTDHSDFRTTHLQVNSAFKNLLNQCSHHPGKIFVPGGTSGRNGALRIAIASRHRATCN